MFDEFFVVRFILFLFYPQTDSKLHSYNQIFEQSSQNVQVEPSERSSSTGREVLPSLLLPTGCFEHPHGELDQEVRNSHQEQ